MHSFYYNLSGGGVNAQGDSSKSNCLQNNFCNIALCDTCTTPFSSIVKDMYMGYGKYSANPGYPGDVQYSDENDGTCHPE